MCAHVLLFRCAEESELFWSWEKHYSVSMPSHLLSNSTWLVLSLLTDLLRTLRNSACMPPMALLGAPPLYYCHLRHISIISLTTLSYNYLFNHLSPPWFWKFLNSSGAVLFIIFYLQNLTQCLKNYR